MAERLARVLFYGDDHLSSKQYGGHVDYPNESLYYYKYIGNLAEQLEATHIIGLGDFTYGRFNTLEYRNEVENELKRQYNLVNGNIWKLKGNHDKASYGMTEYEYYLGKGMFKGTNDGAAKLEIGNVVIDLRDYGHEEPVDLTNNKKHILAVHGYYVFKNSNLQTFNGVAKYLDELSGFYGVDFILAGHIHEEHRLQGYISDGNGNTYPTVVHYLPCLSRPAYHGDKTPTRGCVDYIDIFNDGTYDFNTYEFDLLPIEKSFDIESIAKKKEKKSVELAIDLSDIVKNLTDHKIDVANPEDVIMAQENIPLKYREKAKELYMENL